MYDHELALIGETFERDQYGNQVPVETRIPILCKLMSVGRQEFYAAAQSGLKPELVFVIHAYEYNGERKVEFEGSQYNVVRTYRTGFEEMELICQEVVANRNS